MRTEPAPSRGLQLRTGELSHVPAADVQSPLGPGIDHTISGLPGILSSATSVQSDVSKVMGMNGREVRVQRVGELRIWVRSQLLRLDEGEPRTYGDSLRSARE